MTLYNAATDDDKPATSDDDIVKEANERWRAVQEFQGTEDERSREDTKFANGDARNNWQWPDKIYAERTGGGQEGVALTINTTRVHNDLIINELSKNAFGIKIRPTGGKASYKSAQVMQSICRRIEYISTFSSVRRRVSEQQVDGGIGYVIIETAYVSERSFDQDIFLKAPRDPTGVYLDPWIKEPDGSDANFGFIFESMPRKEFNRKYPKWKNKVGASPLSADLAVWLTDKEIIVCKYYRKKAKPDLLVGWKDASGAAHEKLKSEIVEESGPEICKALLEDIENGVIDGRTREVENNEVEWFLIAGDKIIDRGPWAGKYIPICRCVGRELVVDKTLDRKGHTRPQIDAQRMLNYDASMSVEMVALQPRAPYLASSRALEGQEQFKTLNINNFPVILFNDLDEEAPEGAQIVAAPVRQDPPKPSEAYHLGMQAAERWQMMISGQFQAQMGENDTQSAASGRAISERQQQGDTATYHFPEHQSDMLRLIGKQLLDLIPKIYDTERTLHVIDAKNEKQWLRIDPNQKEAIQELQHDAEDEEAVKMAFNPSVGEYECISEPGPDYGTKREEAWEKIALIMHQNKNIATICGDLLFKYGDFPGADELHERLLKEIKATKPYLFDDGAEPQMQALQQQNQRLVALNSELMTKLADKGIVLRGRDEKRDVEAFRADTDRMNLILKFLTETMLTPEQKLQMQHELEVQGRQHIFDMIQQANQPQVTNGSGTGQ